MAQAACLWFVVPFFVVIASHLMASTIKWESQRSRRGKAQPLLLLSGSLFVWVVLFYTGRAGLWRDGMLAVIFSANLLFAGGLMGCGLASGIRKPSELLPVCAVVCTADVVSFLKGPTGVLAEGVAAYYEAGMAGPPPWADFLLIKIPVPGISGFVPLFGVTDWVVAACLTAASRRLCLDLSLFGERSKRGVLGIMAGVTPPPAVVGLLAAIVLAYATGRFVPGMPMMVLVYLPLLLARSRQARSPRRKDVWLTFLFPLVVVSAGCLV